MMASLFQMNTACTSGTGSLSSNTVANPKGELKAITTRSGLVLDGPTFPMPPPFVNPEEDQRVEETLTDPKHAVILKKLPEKLGDPGKFLIPCGFSELKYKALANLGMDIARDRLVPVGKFAFLARSSYFVSLIMYESVSCSPSSWEEDLSYGPLMLLIDEFADELAHFTFPPEIDYLPFDSESDLQEIEYLLNHDPIKEMDYILEDSVDKNSPDDNLVDTISEIRDKIKESKLLIDELDLPGSSNFFLPFECDLVFYEIFPGLHALPLTNNDDKVFNPGILIHGNLFEVTIRVTPNKNVKNTTNTSLILEDFNPPLYELPFHKEVPGSEILLSFSSENEEKVFNPGILTSKGVHTSLLRNYLHRGSKAFKVIKLFKSPMEIFPCSYGEDIHILDVPCLYFYPP
ncbi:hypothetical protein Tco_0210086 [Tanacetum coccineum]